MDLIERYIRKIILERDDVTTPSGYKIKILSSYYGDSNVERLRSKLVNDRAQENGCIQGFMIVATKKVKTGNDSKLIDDVINAMQSNKTLMQYYDKDFRIIMSEPRTIGKRKKVFAVWVLDMRETSRFKQLLNRINNIFSDPDSLRITIPKTAKTYILKFLNSDVDIIQQRDAIQWTNSIDGFLQDLRDNDVYVYNQILNPKDKFSVRLLNSIPNFDKMLLGVNVDDEDSTTSYKQTNVTIDNEWVKNNFAVAFRGKATIEISPITGEQVLIPETGKLYGIAVQERNEFSDDGVIFKGKFDNDGKPVEGTYFYILEQAPTDDGDLYSFTGTLTSNWTITFDASGTGTRNIQWEFIKGKLYYWNSRPNHSEDGMFTGTYQYFEGTFDKKSPLNGNIYRLTLKDGNWEDPYQLIGKVTGGKIKYYNRNVTFPYTWDNTIYYQDPNDANSIYAYFSGPGSWIQVPKQTFVDYAIDKELTATEYATSVTPIVDPDLSSGLCKTFNVTDDFVTIKPNANNLVRVYIKTKVGTSTIFKDVGDWVFAGASAQNRRRVKYKNVTESGYKQVGLIENLLYDTETAKFKFNEISFLEISSNKYNIYIKETDLQ